MDPCLPTERERVWLEGDRTVCPGLLKTWPYLTMTIFSSSWMELAKSPKQFWRYKWGMKCKPFPLFLLYSLTFNPAPSPRSLWGRCPVIELSSSSFMQSTGSEADVKRRAKGYQFRIRSLKRDWDLRSSQILQLNHWFFFSSINWR